jgi:hypothetical protein
MAPEGLAYWAKDLEAARLLDYLTRPEAAGAEPRMLEQTQQPPLVALVAPVLTLIRLGPLRPLLVFLVIMQAVEVAEPMMLGLVVLAVLEAAVAAPLVLLELMEQLTPAAEVVQEANQHLHHFLTAALAVREL